MIRITHEFPLCLYQDETAEKLTDFTVCSFHLYQNNEAYRNFMQNQIRKGRIVVLNNSRKESTEFRHSKYVKVIKELKPTYYVLPDLNSDADEEDNFFVQYNFLEIYKDLPGTPIAVPHSTSLIGLGMQVNRFCKEFPFNVEIAISSSEIAFENNKDEVGYFNEKDVSYLPLRLALNRKMFLKTYASTLKSRRIHLLGCETLAEFNHWNSNFDRSNIVSLITSHPVAMSLEGPCNTYRWGFFNPEKGIKMPMHFYKPRLSINKDIEKTDYENLDIMDNVLYFQDHARNWINALILNTGE